MDDELLTVEEAANRLKIHPVTLRNMLRAGAMKGMKFGAREWRIPTNSLREFVEARMKRASGPHHTTALITTKRKGGSSTRKPAVPKGSEKCSP